jgi:hypothetical protein
MAFHQRIQKCIPGIFAVIPKLVPTVLRGNYKNRTRGSMRANREVHERLQK